MKNAHNQMQKRCSIIHRLMIEQIRLIKTKTNNATDEQTFAIFEM